MNSLFLFDEEVFSSQLKTIVGVDEVGRGPGAGPVYACAYSFFQNYAEYLSIDEIEILKKLNDSKKISSKNREILAEILKKCGNWAIFSVDEEKIDEINILNATFLAMKGAILSLNLSDLSSYYFLIDGNKKIKEFEYSQQTIVKGDSKSASIAAASIIAKVARDDYMIRLSNKFPYYFWDKNKGYLTHAHIEAIKKFGIVKHHRKSFVKNFLWCLIFIFYFLLIARIASTFPIVLVF